MHVSWSAGYLLTCVLSWVASQVSLVLFAQWTHGHTTAIVARPQVFSDLYWYVFVRTPLSQCPKQSDKVEWI